MLERRDAISRALRNWFHQQGFVEVHTPLLVPTVIPESTIETFRIARARRHPERPGELVDLFLIPSPELNMKRLLARGMERIYQLGPVFRKEEDGSQHLPEFLMLEWYRAGSDYTALMADCESLMQHAAEAAGLGEQVVLPTGRTVHITAPFERISVNDAFEQFAGWTPGPAPDPDRFNMDMVQKVEPALAGFERPVFLYDYPASMASLSRLKPGNRDVAERVELYAGGIELANGFSELTDPEEQAARFKRELETRKELGLEARPWPEEFLKDLDSMPQAAGMAMGVDRLVMLLCSAEDIRQVTLFQ